MELRPIKTELDYQNALQEIEQLFDAEPNSPECDRLDILTTLVEAYEQTHFSIEAPDPIIVFSEIWRNAIAFARCKPNRLN